MLWSLPKPPEGQNFWAMNNITSRKNDMLKRVRKLNTDRDYRAGQGEFVCEGIKAFEQAIACGAQVTAVFIQQEIYERLAQNLVNIDTYVLDKQLVEYISSVQTCQGIVFTCKTTVNRPNIRPGGKYIILDGINDPGNLGTMIRTASAFDIGQIILVNNCADVYNPKTVRSTMGAVFNHNCCLMEVLEVEKHFCGQGINIYGAALVEQACDIREISFENCAAVIGSEAQGISPEIQRLCGKFFIIPINPNTQSLNAAVAGGIVMWEMGKQ